MSRRFERIEKLIGEPLSLFYTEFLRQNSGAKVEIGGKTVYVFTVNKSSLMFVDDYIEKYRVAEWIPIGLMGEYNEREDLVFINNKDDEIWARGKRLL